jgi:hypothetical protein
MSEAVIRKSVKREVPAGQKPAQEKAAKIRLRAAVLIKLGCDFRRLSASHFPPRYESAF